MTRAALAFCLAAAAASAQAIAQSRQWVQEMWSPPRLALDAPDTPHARFGLDAAPWVAEAVAARAAARGDSPQARQVALLQGAGERIYLAIGWRGDGIESVEILAAPPPSLWMPDGVPPLRLVRAMANDWAYLTEPSGVQPFPGEPPVLTMRHSGGAPGVLASTRIILLTGDTVDITPDWAGRTLGLRDLDSDGTVDIVAIDEAWHGYPFYCTACGPMVITILHREAGRTRLACAESPVIYRPLLARPTHAEDWRGLLAGRADAALINAQIGRFEEARTAAASLVEIATMYDAHDVTQSSLHLLDEARRIAADVARAATAGHESGCPLTASRSALPSQWWVPLEWY